MLTSLWLIRLFEAGVWASLPAAVAVAVDAGPWHLTSVAGLAATGVLVVAARSALDTRVYGRMFTNRVLELVDEHPASGRAKAERFWTQIEVLEKAVPDFVRGSVDLVAGMVYLASTSTVGLGLTVAAIGPATAVAVWASKRVHAIGELKNETAAEEAKVFEADTPEEYKRYYERKLLLNVMESDVDAWSFLCGTGTLQMVAVASAAAVLVAGGTPASAIAAYMYSDRAAQAVTRLNASMQRLAAASAAKKMS